MDMDFERRFGGLRRLYGVQGAQRLFDAQAVVVGLGGVGSWAAEALARSGVGRLVLIDMDHIAESNVNRQVHAITPSLGQAKGEALRERIALINPQCRVELIDDFVTPDNWGAIAARLDADAGVLDACDQVSAKTTLAAWAREHGCALVSVGAAGGKRLAHRVEMDDLCAVTHDPLLAQLRYRLRKHHGAPREGAFGVACVFSRETVAPPDASCDIDGSGDGSLNCHGYGSVVTVTATFGLCAAGWLLDRFAEGPAKKMQKNRPSSKSVKNDAII